MNKLVKSFCKKLIFIILILIPFIGAVTYSRFAIHSFEKMSNNFTQIKVCYNYKRKIFYVNDNMIIEKVITILNKGEWEQRLKENRKYDYNIDIEFYIDEKKSNYSISIFQDKDMDYSVWILRKGLMGDKRKINSALFNIEEFISSFGIEYF